jgi:hypothetical protein
MAVRTCLCLFQLAPLTISKYQRQLFEILGADKTCVFLSLVAKMSDRFLEQPINIKFCVKIGKLSLEKKHGAFNMIPKINDKFYNGNNRKPRPKKPRISK